MNTPTIYTATPADLSPPVQTDSFCVDLVLATDYQKLKDEFKQLAAENVALKAVCGGDGSYRNCPACTFSEYIEAPETPATDRIVAGIKADGVDSGIKTIITMLNHQAPGVLDAINVLSVHSFELREGADK